MNEARSATVASRRTVRQRYPWLLPGGLLLLLAFLAVNVLAHGPLVAADRRIHKAVHRTASSADWRWLKAGPATPARILIDLGNIRFAFPILLVIAGYAAYRRRSPRPLITAVIGIVLILAIVVPAKILVGRPNPGYHQLHPHQLLGAFPSGHATTACVCYILAVLIVTAPESRRRQIALRAAAVLGALVGMAMIWCGLHWFTDVIAGFALAGLIVPFTVWLTCRDGGPEGPGQASTGETRTLPASTEPRAPDSTACQPTR